MNLFYRSFDQKYEVLISALEGGVLNYSTIKGFDDLCKILGVSSRKMKSHIYEELGLSTDELIEMYKN